MSKLKTIVVIGPESTGKSTLCKDLANHYKCDFLEEYARVYLEENGPDYTYEDVEKMASGQCESQNNFILKNEGPIAIIDTDLIVYKVWIEEKYQKQSSFVETQIENFKADHYFLCDVDIPWTFDELREHPLESDRNRLYKRYEELLTSYSKPFTILSGGRQRRLEDAISILTNLI